MTTVRAGSERVALKRVVQVMPSNVDKHSVEGEQPVRLCNYVDVYKNDRVTNDIDYMHATASDAQVERFTLRAQDVVITKDSEEPTDIGVPAFVPEDMPGVVCGYHLAVLRPDLAKLHGGFLTWWLRSAEVHAYFSTAATGISRYALSVNDIGMTPVYRPPLGEQQRIANFLDEQTARIDVLIAEKTELAERLAELSQSTIADEILGRGAAKRQPTNVRELGDIPSGWVVAPMMRLTDPSRPIMYGIVLPGPNVEEGPSVPIVKGGDVRPQRLRLELLNRTTPEIELPYARARLREGDIVYSIRGTIGDAELVPAELTGANITQDVARISPRRDVDGRWLLYAAKSRPVFAQLEQLSLGAAVRGINIFDLKRAKVPTPPIAVQRLIADKLDTLIARFHALQKHSLAHIALLREYRSSLISAAVTGQLDVSAYQLQAAEELVAT